MSNVKLQIFQAHHLAFIIQIIADDKKKKRNAKFVYLDERDGEMQKQEVLDRTVAQMKRELFAKKKNYDLNTPPPFHPNPDPP